MELIAEWTNTEDSPSRSSDGTETESLRRRAEEQALKEMKTLHASTPKYRFDDKSQVEVIQECDVDVIDLKAIYLRDAPGKKVQIFDEDKLVFAEEFASRYIQRLGYSVFATESRPFHVMFGVFMWILVQDPADPLNRMVEFGNRQDFDEGRESSPIRTLLPADFGTLGYGEAALHRSMHIWGLR